MRAPLSWIRDFTPAPDDVELLVQTFNMLGLVVEGVERAGDGLDGVVVGYVLDVRAHPNADKVRLADVDLGTGEPQQIACGAANLAPGQKVPVATLGATLPNGMTIERRKMRGEWSNGMICAEDEIGLAKERVGGIMVLPEDLSVGAPFAEAMGIEKDVIFDLEIETNRPDAMCIAGIARDLAGKLELPFTIPEPAVAETGAPVSSLATVAIEAPELCSRFTARVLQGVNVAPSPEKVRRRLTMAGMRPINNVVDASNYVMLELGQPSHPYDRGDVAGQTLRARASRAGDALETLDGARRDVPAGSCVITDGDDAVIGVAGIMGGASSEIGDATTEVILEAAVFEPYAVNFASRTMALRTDASARFERRVDRCGLLRAQDRFCEVLAMSSPGLQVAAGVIDQDHGEAWPSPAEQLTLRTSRVNAILGTELSETVIAGLLGRIGFSVEEGDGRSTVVVPSFRPDVEREIDVIEEVARVHGYDSIARRVPTSPTAAQLTRPQNERRRLRSLLAGMGSQEAWTSALVDPEDAQRAGEPVTVGLTNPMTREESVLRPSLLPGLLRAVAHNVARREPELCLFETGHVFAPPRPGDEIVHERDLLAVVVTGAGVDGMTAARTWRDLCAAMRSRGLEVKALPLPGLHPTRSAAITTPGGAHVGRIGEVDGHLAGHHGIENRVGFIEVELGALFDSIDATPQLREISRFPSAEFDLAFAVDEHTAAEDVRKTLCTAVGDGGDVTLFDVFRGAVMKDGQRSLAFRLRVTSLDHTLTDQEITEVRQRAVGAVERAHHAELRA